MLQFAMDGAADRSVEDALIICDKVFEETDIIECGTSFVLKFGMELVRCLKREFPEKLILADTKIMDGGYHNCATACKNGADIVTVLGVSDKQTIKQAIKAAHDYQREIMVDFICAENKLELLKFCEEEGADYVCVHSGVDVQALGETPLETLKLIMANRKKCKVAVAGGINEKTAASICELRPDVLIAGGSIYKAEDPLKAAKAIKDVINSYNGVI